MTLSLRNIVAGLTALLLVAQWSDVQAQLTMGDVLQQSQPVDWRRPDPNNTVYLELGRGRVIIELAPEFAPAHVANLRTLIEQRYFDGLAFVRSQDNYVAQFGDPNAGDPTKARPLGSAKIQVAGEYFRSAQSLPFQKLNSEDAYANEVGFSSGFPAGRDGEDGRAWLVHCYAMVGVGRDVAPDSGNGAEIYVVTGHSPRHLDRNVTLVGRVLQGMELLSTLPRGTGDLGFYELPEQMTPIQSVRFASDLPTEERTHLELLRTDTTTFEKLVKARTYRSESWFIDPAGRIEVCNVPLPIRAPQTP